MRSANWTLFHSQQRRRAKIFVRQFVPVFAFQEINMKVCSCVAQVKTVSEFTEDMKNKSLKTGKFFSTKGLTYQPCKYLTAAHENRCMRWP
jgi:hypothetical protein